jgi:large subunit ribosomal protein L35e
LTVINQKTKEKAIEKYQKKKFKPLDIRRKKTRSLRRKLTAREANAKTLKEKKKLQNYPMRKFALAA